MARFITKLLKFILPIVIVLGVFFGVPFYIGETIPVTLAIDLQKQNRDLIYSSPLFDASLLFAYKIEIVNTRQPDIIVSGSSRSYRLPAAVFNRNPEAFYNMGMPATSYRFLPELMPYITDDAKPDIIIWAIDQAYFVEGIEAAIDGNVGNLVRPLFDKDRDLAWYVKKTVQSWKSILYDSRYWFANTENRLGLHAVFVNIGSHYDGTAFNGHYVSTNRDLFNQSITSLEEQTRFLKTGDIISENRIQEIDDTLQLLHEQGIYVVGYFPPFAPLFSERMELDDGYNYIDVVANELTPIFEKYDFSFFDFSDVRELGFTDAMFIDGWHPSERASIMIYLEMLDALPDIFAPYSDRTYIEGLLEMSDDPYGVVYNPVDGSQIIPENK